ncbi:MAG: hypothetical protein V1659_00285 [Candidatus Woesearchaeota archaeon]
MAKRYTPRIPDVLTGLTPEEYASCCGVDLLDYRLVDVWVAGGGLTGSKDEVARELFSFLSRRAPRGTEVIIATLPYPVHVGGTTGRYVASGIALVPIDRTTIDDTTE